MGDDNNSNLNIYDAIIIGAGCAGLKAAETLSTNGIKNILVLEAQDRLGGRINTIWLNNDKNIPLEMGANWIHGIIDNPLKNLTLQNPDVFKHLKKKFIDLDNHKKYFIDLNGKKYESDMCDQIENVYHEWYEEALKLWHDDEKRHKIKNKNLQEFFDDLFIEFTKDDTKELKELKLLVFNAFKSYLCVYISCNSLSECSLSELGSFILFPGPDEEFPGGYTTLINHLANRLPKDSLKLSNPVEKIKLEKSIVSVECQNKNIFHAKHVIVTCSLNYLKENYKTLFNSEKILFNDKKIEALNGIKMGIVNNFLLIYENDINFIPTDIDSITPVFTYDNDEDISINGFNKKWYMKIYRILKFYDNVLRFFVYGEDAIYLENISDEEIILTITELLKKLLKNKNIPTPKQLLRSKWFTNKYIRGSYSYIPLGGSTKFIKELAEPIFIDNSPKILFAGEATSENCYSTVHGAFMSGENTANFLMNNFKKMF